MLTRNKLLAALVVPLFAAGTLVAVDANAGPRGERTPEERAQHFTKKMERVEQRVRDKLAPKLGVDEATTNKLVEIFQGQLAQRHQSRQAMRAEMKKLQQLVDEGAGAAALDSQLTRIADLREDMPRRGDALEETARVLTPQQQAVLVLEGPQKMRKRMKHRHRMRRMHQRQLEGGPDADR